MSRGLQGRRAKSDEFRLRGRGRDRGCVLVSGRDVAEANQSWKQQRGCVCRRVWSMQSWIDEARFGSSLKHTVMVD